LYLSRQSIANHFYSSLSSNCNIFDAKSIYRNFNQNVLIGDIKMKVKLNIKLNKLVLATLASTVLLGFGANAVADSTDDILNALIAKGVLTEEEGALLLKGRELEKDTKSKKPDLKFKDGMIIESADGSFKAKIAGRVHADYRNFDYNEGSNNLTIPGVRVTNSLGGGADLAARFNGSNIGADTFDIRRARLGFEAKYKDYYEALLSIDLASNGNTSTSTTILDQGYLNVAWWQPVQFRFGQFKAPMNLEKLTSSNNIDFMERSFVNALAPNEQIGAMVHGVPYTGVTYQLGAFNGTVNGSNRQGESDIREDGKEIVARATVNLAEIMGNKEMISHIGVSYSDGDLPQGQVGANGRTESRGANFFRAPVFRRGAAPLFDNSNRERIGLEGALAYNQFKAQAEWMQETDKFRTAARKYDLDTTNWYVEGLWSITGEKYADGYKNGVMGGIKPIKDFDPATFSGGAWEAGLRYSEFDASDYNTLGVGQGAGAADVNITTTAAGFAKAEAWTAGIKFLPNSNMRFMLNYVDTKFKDVIGGATGGVVLNNKRIDDEKAIIVRTQWMF
jgi:phosphate-selective porin OprO and OprP